MAKHCQTLVCIFSMLASVQICSAQQPDIREAKIASLKEDLTEAITKRGSSTSKRRAYKNVARDADSLIKSSPNASNRFRVLAIKLESQKHLLAVDRSTRNLEALIETCHQLAEAPDDYAELRLEADLLLSERTLSQKNADVEERANALEALLQRYRDTPAEAKSLIIAAGIAPKLEAFDIQERVIRDLTNRFPAHHEAIEFRRSTLNEPLSDVQFRGTFTRSDGTILSFPMDRMGHSSLLYFWSRKTPEIERRLAEVKAMQDQFPDRFDVFSFNLDELPDAGEQTLRSLGLNWTALHLPGGQANATYRAYATENPNAVLVNAQGHALLTNGLLYKGKLPLIPRIEPDGSHPKPVRGNAAPTLEQCIDSERYLAQLQSLFIGDFLVGSLEGSSEVVRKGSVPVETLKAIQACFIAPPMRYRLTREQALANYTKAETLCREAIAKHADASDLWQVHNRRIIALLGMWNLATEPKYLEAAVEIAKASLAGESPAPAQLVPRFCLAKDAVRRGDSKSASVPERYFTPATFVKGIGGADTPGSTLAAAAIVALDANARDAFAEYRGRLLADHANDPTLWPVITFLRDRHHRYRFFRATHSRFGFTRAERHAVGRNVAALDEPADTTRVMEAELQTVDGGKLILPKDTAGKLTFVAFLELPADEESAKSQAGLLKTMISLADRDESKRINVIAAFLSRDIERITSLVKANEWTCQVALVPGGLTNPLVVRHGILSADRIPNIFLLREDGSVSWSISGISYPIQGSSMAARISNALDANVSLCQMEAAQRALHRGDFQDAIRRFSNGDAPERVRGDIWSTFRCHSRAQAYMALQNWDAALADIDTALEGHKNFGHGSQHPCGLVARLLLTKAVILDQLGQSEEAEQARKEAAKPTRPHNKSPYGLYTEGLDKFRLSPH